MAKNQRGRDSESKSRTMDNSKTETEMSSFSPNSSDDEAPEEVTFAESKSDALRHLQETLNTVRREKEQLKEKRRRRQELFQEQKKRRLLPADVLEEMESTRSGTHRQPEDGDEKKEEEEEEEDHEEEEEEEEEERQRKKTNSGKMSHFRNLKGNYKVSTLKEDTAASYQQRAAEDFIRSRLYGPGSCRTTNNELLSLQSKSGRTKAAAVHFLRKDWASEQRVKAEKLKKQWIHRQGLQSS